MALFEGKRFVPEEAEIPTSSMADIAFLLIIFFILTTTFAREKGIKFVLPEQKQQEVKLKKDKLIIVAINDQGKVFINDQPTTFEDLHDQIKKYLEENDKRIVYIKTHEDAAYDYMIKAFDIAKQVYQEMKLPPKVALGVIKRRAE